MFLYIIIVDKFIFMVNNIAKVLKMQKKDLKQLLKDIGDMHPVIIGLAGMVLLCLPVVIPAEYSYMENYAFIGGLACMFYVGGMGVASKIAAHKARKAQSDKAMAELNARRTEFKRQVQNKIYSRQK